ncbi:MAG: hypothetical protein IJM30_05970 [Thermoguttaceae bacterium]|nr:hypothetical protein [Thermoguttaceae bacterium]
MRETVRLVSEVANVLPLDLYTGTTEGEYRDWNCRYELTYKEFRPNYILYLTARNSTVEELFECLESLSEMSPKEKALTCAALVAFVDARREEEEARDSGNPIERPVFMLSNRSGEEVRSLNDDETRLATQLLEKELDDQSVAFYQAKESDETSAEREQNLREELFRFMSIYRSYDGATSRRAHYDHWAPPTKRDSRRRFFDLFDRWKNESQQLPIEFSRALALVQASFDQFQLYNDLSAVEKSGAPRIGDKARSARSVLTEHFLNDRTSVSKKSDGRLDPMIEGVIMKEFLKAQHNADLAVVQESDDRVCAIRSENDVLVSDVVEKTLDVLSKQRVFHNLDRNPESNCFILSKLGTIAKELVKEGDSEPLNWLEPLNSHFPLDDFKQRVLAQETIQEDSITERRTRKTLLETIRDKSDLVEFFSISLFLDAFKEDLGAREYPSNRLSSPGVFMPITFDLFQSFESIYEVSKEATREEITECLAAFDELSVKERAFVLAATTLYLYRSEKPQYVNAIPEGKQIEPLSYEEKSIFSGVAQDCARDDRTAFIELFGTREDWEESFRKDAFQFQYYLGKSNPIYPFSSQTESLWRQLCDETPIVILYAVLAMETRLDFDKLNGRPRNFDNSLHLDGYEKTNLTSKNWDNESFPEPEEVASEKINAMRHFLLLQIAFSLRDAKSVNIPSPLHPVALKKIDAQRLSDIARQVMEIFPEIRNGGIPSFSNNDAPVDRQ